MDQWYRVAHTHPPIIERPLWDRVQKLLQERSKPFQAGTVGIFSGKVRCANCGYTLRSTKSHGKHYLTCPTRYAAKEACTGAFISVERLENIVLSELTHLTNERLNLEDLTSKLRISNARAQLKQQLIHDSAALEKQIAHCSKGMRDAYWDKVKGIISKTQYLDFSRCFSEELTRLEKLRAQNQQQLFTLEQKNEHPIDSASHIQTYIKPVHLSRCMTDLFIDKIEIGKRIAGTHNVPITIYWNF